MNFLRWKIIELGAQVRAKFFVFLMLFSAFAAANAARASFIADLQIISYCNDDSTQCADAQLDEVLFANIWAQADLTFNILPTIQFDQSSLADIADFNIAIFDQKDNVVPGAPFNGPLPFTIYLGIARESTAGIFGVGFIGDPNSILDGSLGGLFTRTVVGAHLIGHNLGIEFHSEGANTNCPDQSLMSLSIGDPGDPSSFGLCEFNISIIQQSGLITQNGVVGVPEPSTLALFGIGLAGLGFMTRRRRKAGTA